jgi:hypothetical protein
LVVTPNGTKASKLYAIKPTDGSGDLSVTRATTATRVNSSGLIESVATNVPRLDYTNGTCPSILVEPQRTNLRTYSEQFDNAAWEKLNSSVSSNSTTSPDGNTTADSLLDNSDNSVHAILSVISKATSAITYTFSVYAKLKDSGKKISLSVDDAVAGGCDSGVFNLSTGTWDTAIGTPSASFTNPSRSFQNVGNGWYRLNFTITSNTQAQIRSNIFVSNSSNQISYVGNGTGIYIWGAQVEAGSYATSYIPTVASSVTRNADVISKTGISSLIGQTEGVMYVEFDNISPSSDWGIVLQQTLNAYQNSIYLFNANVANKAVVEIYNGGTLQMRYDHGVVFDSGVNRLAIAYKANDFSVALNGTIVHTDNSGSVPTCSILNFADSGIGTNYRYKLNSLALWKTRLTNAELASLTTI